MPLVSDHLELGLTKIAVLAKLTFDGSSQETHTTRRVAWLASTMAMPAAMSHITTKMAISCIALNPARLSKAPPAEFDIMVACDATALVGTLLAFEIDSFFQYRIQYHKAFM